jgi:PAS domain-containing protein
MFEERRRHARPNSVVGYLDGLSARILLERLPIPALAVGDDGIIAFANSACHTMLGHFEISIVGRPLTEFFGIRATNAAQAARYLRDAADTTTVWMHPTNGMVKVVVSEPLLLRADDPVTLVTLTDITESLWSTERSDCDQMVS